MKTKKIAFGQSLRIIGGSWRSRKIPLLALDEVRPTTDRIRETLFNWLQPIITGAYCLDAFAGTGILGLEALSRGAVHVVFVEKQRLLCQHLQSQLQLLQCEDANVYCQQLPSKIFTLPSAKPFDVIFLDPPYNQALLLPMLHWLSTHHLVHEQSLVFFEHAKSSLIIWPDDWICWREQTAGNVHFGLLRYGLS